VFALKPRRPMRPPLRGLWLSLILAGPLTLSAQTFGADEAMTVAGMERTDVTLTIRFFDRQIYFLGDAVQIETVLTNNSPELLRFKVADRREFNVDFVVRTLTNVRLERARQYITARNTNQPVFFRAVELQPGERFGFISDLNNFAALEQAGVYSLQASFAPDLMGRFTAATDRSALVSNTLTLNLRPPVDTPEMREVMDAELRMVLEPQPLPPDEVVNFILSNRQQSDWPSFFLYLDLQSLLQKSPTLSRRFQRSGEADRREMLDQYRQDLQQERLNDELLLVPTQFDILKTTYTPGEATVLVDERFDQGDFIEVRRYTYFLQRRDLIWRVIDFSVQNLGTE
jgi:hypothetical protein